MNLTGEIAIVTGGSSGLGYATTKMLSKRGVRVAVFDLARPNDLDDIELSHFCECDVASENSVYKSLQSVVNTLGKPRLLVNCAGIAVGKRVIAGDTIHDLNLFEKVIRVNLTGTFNVIRLVVNEMRQLNVSGDSGSRGLIINTTSIAAFEGQIGQAAYSASKGGVSALTLPLAREFSQFGIRVVGIAPGLVRTPMLESMPIKAQRRLEEEIPFPRRFGRPSEFAGLVGHIIDNELLNGEIIRLDGAVRLAPR